ncbi:MAG: hypothetical protein ACTS80_01000 [Candidatus Hodgkinia cicadicola]
MNRRWARCRKARNAFDEAKARRCLSWERNASPTEEVTSPKCSDDASKWHDAIETWNEHSGEVMMYFSLRNGKDELIERHAVALLIAQPLAKLMI